MSDQVNVEPTAKVIDDIAEELELKVRDVAFRNNCKFFEINANLQ